MAKILQDGAIQFSTGKVLMDDESTLTGPESLELVMLSPQLIPAIGMAGFPRGGGGSPGGGGGGAAAPGPGPIGVVAGPSVPASFPTDVVFRLNTLSTATTKNFSSRVASDSGDRFLINAAGTMSWGPGNGALPVIVQFNNPSVSNPGESSLDILKFDASNNPTTLLLTTNLFAQATKSGAYSNRAYVVQVRDDNPFDNTVGNTALVARARLTSNATGGTLTSTAAISAEWYAEAGATKTTSQFVFYDTGITNLGTPPVGTAWGVYIRGFPTSTTTRISFQSDDPAADIINAGNLRLGVPTATTGRIRIDNNQNAYARNATNTGNIFMWGTDAGNVLYFGDTTAASIAIGFGASVVRIVTGAGSLSFFGVPAVGRPAAYTVTNPVTRRSYDTTTVTLPQLAQVVGTIIADQQGYGLFQ
jgi:hypothetical protein